MRLARYSKAVAALLAGLATAGALLPTDAPAWMLAAVPVVNAVVVVLAPRNAPPPQFPSPAPTRYQREPPTG